MSFNDALADAIKAMALVGDDAAKKKLKEERPNFTLMNLGFILKLKELKCPTTSYKYLIKFVTEENKSKYGLNK